MNIRFAFAFFIASYSLLVPRGSEAPRNLVISCPNNQTELEITSGDKRLLLYTFATNQFKPYIKQLYTLAGQNVLRDAPADHLHHHGLMYAIRVNGVNFWEEVGDPGHERSGKILSQSIGKTLTGLSQATFTHLIHWVAHEKAFAAEPAAVSLLTETRTITVTINTSREEVAIDWRGEFEVGAAPVKLTGSFYNGLGLRLPESFDHVASHQNSEFLPYSAEQERDITPARWSAVTGLVNERPATIALFETPSNKGQSRFFTMLNPFAYLSVTQNLENQPLSYAPQDRFSVRYLITIYPGSRGPEFLEARYREWFASANN